VWLAKADIDPNQTLTDIAACKIIGRINEDIRRDHNQDAISAGR